MATLDLTEPVSRIRLNIGDTSDLPFLADTEIEYSLAYNNNNENATTKQCAGFILAKMAMSGHEKIGQLEFWGETVFSQYKSYLKDILNNSVFNATGGIYVAGMLKDDVEANKIDPLIVQHKLPVYDYEPYDNEDIHTTPLNF